MCKPSDGGDDRKPDGGCNREDESPKLGTPHVQGLPEAIPQTPDECDVSIQGKCIFGRDETDVVGVFDNGELDSMVDTVRGRESNPGLYIGELVSNPGSGLKGEIPSRPVNGRCSGLLIDCSRSSLGCNGLDTDSGVKAELFDG